MTCPEGRRFRRAPLPPIAKLTAATTTKKNDHRSPFDGLFLVFFSSRFMFVIFFLDGSRLVFFKLINHRRTVCFSFVLCVCVCLVRRLLHSTILSLSIFLPVFFFLSCWPFFGRFVRPLVGSTGFYGVILGASRAATSFCTDAVWIL